MTSGIESYQRHRESVIRKPCHYPLLLLLPLSANYAASIMFFVMPPSVHLMPPATHVHQNASNIHATPGVAAHAPRSSASRTRLAFRRAINAWRNYVDADVGININRPLLQLFETPIISDGSCPCPSAYRCPSHSPFFTPKHCRADQHKEIRLSARAVQFTTAPLLVCCSLPPATPLFVHTSLSLLPRRARIMPLKHHAGYAHVCPRSTPRTWLPERPSTIHVRSIYAIIARFIILNTRPVSVVAAYTRRQRQNHVNGYAVAPSAQQRR
jgi:hypothetical protein